MSISLRSQVTLVEGNNREDILDTDILLLTTGVNQDAQRKIVGTTESSIPVLVAIGDLGYVRFKNHDSTNYVRLGFATGVYVIRIFPRQVALFPAEPGTTTFFVIANTASVQISYRFWER